MPVTSANRVYPRACGGTTPRYSPSATGTGLSPRLRGNRRHPDRGADRHRSIPAPAGEPLASCQRPRQCPVYPRACGGTLRSRIIRLRALGSIPAPAGEPARSLTRVVVYAGLSPRLRGNHPPVDRRQQPRGVYPRACGGTHCAVSSTRFDDLVYPRACGGTQSTRK